MKRADIFQKARIVVSLWNCRIFIARHCHLLLGFRQKSKYFSQNNYFQLHEKFMYVLYCISKSYKSFFKIFDPT